MDYVKEFAFPLTPFFFETALRSVFLPGLFWAEYINPGTLMVTMAIWCMMTAIKFPSEQKIAGDTEVLRERETVRSTILLIAAYGLLFFGAYVTATVISARLGGTADVASLIALVFAILAITYSVGTGVFIWLNRSAVESFFHV